MPPASLQLQGHRDSARFLWLLGATPPLLQLAAAAAHLPSAARTVGLRPAAGLQEASSWEVSARLQEGQAQRGLFKWGSSGHLVCPIRPLAVPNPPAAMASAAIRAAKSLVAMVEGWSGRAGLSGPTGVHVLALKALNQPTSDSPLEMAMIRGQFAVQTALFALRCNSGCLSRGAEVCNC